MRKNTAIILFLALLIIGGIFIVIDLGGGSQNTSSSETSTTSTIHRTQPSYPNPATEVQSYNNDVLPAHKRLKDFPEPPGEGATEEERSNFLSFLIENATKSSIIEIESSCVLSPTIVLLESDSHLRIRNTDSTTHTFRLPFLSESHLIDPGQEVIIFSDRLNLGSFGVDCDGAIQAGYIVVVPSYDNF